MNMEKLTEMLEAARNRQGGHYFNGFIYAYCENGRCTGRKFSIQIKTYGAKDPVSVRCPLCGEIAIADCAADRVVETLDEYFERIDREARCNVNIQRHRKQPGFGCISVSLLFDDSLPD
jgi:hypothetical protein